MTDHKSLESLFNEKKAIPTMAAARIQRWALTLAARKYTVEYQPGAEHSNVDKLSRLPLLIAPIPLQYQLRRCGPWNFRMLHQLVSKKCKMHGTRSDIVLSQVVKCVEQGWSSQSALQPYFTRKEELMIQHGCLLWGSSVVIPPKMRTRVTEELHETHPGIFRLKALARSHV